MATLRLQLSKLKTPDSFLVKWLALVKTILQNVILVLRQPSVKTFRLAVLILRVKPWYTMVSTPRLVNLYERVQDANRLGLPGALVECGTWHGGASALMARAALDRPSDTIRTSWCFDSFQGLPPPGDQDSQSVHDLFFDGWCKGDTDKVRQAFQRLNIPLDNLKIVPGWFSETLSRATIPEIAVLHVDADWYDSVKIVLDTLYDKLVPGGFVIIDDYWVWEGCQKAVNEFLLTRQIKVEITNVANLAIWFQKPA